MSDDELQQAWERGAEGRARQLEARARRRRRVILIVTLVPVLAVLTATALALSDGKPSARTGLVPPTIPVEPTSPFVDPPTCRAPLTPDDPLRIWIGGDSLAGSLGPALGELTADTGVVLPTYDYRTSSGLTSPSFFDWPAEATDEMARVDPEIVVFIIGANDTGYVRSTPTNLEGTPAWRASYALLVKDMLDRFTADGRAVYWIGSPTLRDDEKNSDAREINEVARETVSTRDDAKYVDAFRLFSDAHGEFTATLSDSDGKDVRVRTSDGIHFTPAGADLLAQYVFAYLDQRCNLTHQAVEGRRQPVRQSPGSGEVPTTHTEPSSTSSTGATTPSSTSTSTSSSTVPPITVPSVIPGL